MTSFTDPKAYATKLARVNKAVTRDAPKVGLAARAKVTQTFIVNAAKARGGVGRLANDKWASVRTVDDDVVEIRLRGGFAHLEQRGSYKKVAGWDEGTKTVTARRIKNAARRGVTLKQKKTLTTPYGPRLSVHHPAYAPRPFWTQGVTASREPGFKAYQKVHQAAILKAAR